MRKLDKPKNNIDEIMRDCTSNLRDSNLKNRFVSCITFIENYAKQFEVEMRAVNVHTFSPHTDVNSVITKDEMVKLYTDKLSKQKQPGRKHYDKIIVSAPNGQCPICGVRPVATIDHFMGKKLYPSLSISPVNLVPACRDCNSSKGEKRFSSPEDTHLHPYFDDIDDRIWLKAEVRNDPTGYIVLYHVIKPAEWDMTLFERVCNHFKLFEIQKIYCLQAVDEISSVEFKLRKIKTSAGVQVLYQDIQDTIQSCEKASLNSWKSALYRGLVCSRWFVEDYL